MVVFRGILCHPRREVGKKGRERKEKGKESGDSMDKEQAMNSTYHRTGPFTLVPAWCQTYGEEEEDGDHNGARC